jgi:hypothetical protein
MTDVMDEATDDMYAFLPSLDSGYVGYVELIVDPSRFVDLLYRYHHSHGEIMAHPLIPSEHMKFVWKLIEWENGEATIKSLSEKKTRHILQPLHSIKNRLSSMSVSLL